MPIISARGCAFRCSFCHFVYWDDPYRNRTPESILGEIKYLIEKYNVNHIDFFDDLTFASAHQVVKLCDAIEKSGLKFKWSASIRVDLFSRAKLSFDDSLKVAKRMKANGCITSGFALESGNKEILKMMNKEIDPSEFLTTVKIMREAEIYVPISVIFGYPIETKETIKETFDQCVKAGIYPSIGFLLPLPYTAMYDYAKANGYITDEDRYLDSITERQDICVNMTKLSDKVIMDEIKIGAANLNDMLKLGLTEETYIKTKGYKTSKKFFKKGKHALDPENIKRIENDVSFNYSQTEFKFEEQQNC
jgi:anaerobic magnesium-protoporphyrin IX monomethyl ester cyclase